MIIIQSCIFALGTMHGACVIYMSCIMMLSDFQSVLLCVCVCMSVCVFGIYVCVFVGCCLATKVFLGKLPATRGVWVIIG